MRMLSSLVLLLLLGLFQACGNYANYHSRSKDSLEKRSRTSPALGFAVPAAFENKLTVSNPIDIGDQSGVRISHKKISNPDGPCIYIHSAKDIIIEDSLLGPCKGEAVVVKNSSNVVIKNNYMKKAAGGLQAQSSERIQFLNNYVENIISRGHMVQFDKVNGEGNLIQNNISINIPNESETKDIINLYQSNGTSTSPIIIRDNYIKGGGPDGSEGGILLGDNGGSYQQAIGNITVDPGQFGVHAAGGSHMMIGSNQIYARQQWYTSYGIQASGGCDSVDIVNNRVGFTGKRGDNTPSWIDDSCRSLQLKDNSFNEPYRDPGPPAGWGPGGSGELTTAGRGLVAAGQACDAAADAVGSKWGRRVANGSSKSDAMWYTYLNDRGEFENVYCFENGKWVPSVRGAILATYAAWGSEWGPLGFPRNQESSLSESVRYSCFDGGLITWSAETGQTTVEQGSTNICN